MKINITGIGDLETIIAHYKAIGVLIKYAQETQAVSVLHKWDEERNKQPKDIEIILKSNCIHEENLLFSSPPPIKKYYCAVCNSELNLGLSNKKGRVTGHCPNCKKWFIIT